MPVWLLAAGLAAPFLLCRSHPAWAEGLWLGQALGLLTAGWINISVRRAFAAGGVRRAGLLWHSTARLAMVGAVLWLAIKVLLLPVWAMMAGYTWMVWLTAVWQVRPTVLKRRGA